MQVIAPPRSASRRLPLLSVLWGLVFGTLLVAIAVGVAYLSVGTSFLTRVSVGGPLTAGRVLVGVLAWTIALTAPVGFGMVGVQRILGALERLTGYNRRTPAVRAAKSLPDDLHAAVGILLPDGGFVPELVIGPFGAAVIGEMPPPRTLRRTGTSWEGRMANGRWRPVEGPLDRTARDAERVRRWFAADELDFVVKVHAAVVDPSGTLERTASCAVVRPEQLAGWLASLPPQRALSPDRRAQLVDKVRARL